MIDITKKYRTRDGRPTRGLKLDEDGDIEGYVDWHRQVWYPDGQHLSFENLDLVPDPDQVPEPRLLIPDPLAVEYGRFVAAVRLNAQHGTFANIPDRHLEQWIRDLTPTLQQHLNATTL